MKEEVLRVKHRIKGKDDYSFDFHSHPEYEIYFFHKGSCRYLIHNKIYDLEPGDILLMDGLTMHRPNFDPNMDYVRSLLHFSPEWIKGLLEELGCMYLIEVFQKLHHCLIRTNESEQSKKLEGLIYQLSELKNKTDDHDELAETEMKVLFIQILIKVYQLGQLVSLKIPNQKGDKIEHAENIANYIQHNYMKKLTLITIAEALNLSKSYVSHVFKEMTGYTVMEYVMGCRLTQVKYLLEMEPNKAIHEIAYECGFESASHFSRYFNEKIGVTAREYRKMRLQS
ncbi:AraC family transcriptional regulator [Metabacillus niabensis]|uniref:AraC-like DNA-binding protein n=1 Tax=Metabacillus niabensis TaxID=324854 RepID=A0ABT9Z1R9_9BACI|nr:AraC family transcriptional regulator [Metabacillus niabensis]MDQ0226180.1 AraC-like DNA-binding protein [Metabacillus niabensis]